MNAILTHYLHSTITKADRLQVISGGSSSIRSVPLQSTLELAHRAAVVEFLGADNRRFLTGRLPNGDYCHVFLD